MTGKGKKKICVTEEISELTSGGEFSCAICCGRSSDVKRLCDPVTTKGDNLFCD